MSADDLLPGQPVTLDNCAREPIHIPGSIQPHGVLLACRGSDVRIQQVSRNIDAWLGITAEDALSMPFGSLLARDSAERLYEAIERTPLRELSPLSITTARGVALDATLHRSGDALIIELERTSAAPVMGPRGFDPHLRASVLRMQGAQEIDQLCRVAAEEVHAVTGFDRVMVYRFDREWNGEVVAEVKRDDLAPFLGLHYPASDIPAQARRLYTLNWIRSIADVAYEPVPLVPAFDPVTAAPLDLSHATLRSVSPIHIQYLRNMGVAASASVSLVIDGQLAGLIACHHYRGPRLIDSRTRDTVEFLGQCLSWQLRVLESAALLERQRAANEKEAEVVRSLAANADITAALAIPALLELAGAAGACIVLDEEVRTIGQTPSAVEIGQLVQRLRELGEAVHATDHLRALLPEAATWDIAGLLAVEISHEVGEYLLWFRPSVERTIDWAGEPAKTAQPDAPERLSPRGSFALWRETVHGRSTPWQRWEIDAASNLRRVLLSGIRRRSVELRRLNDRLVELDRTKDQFIATVSHELRTPLNAIAGWTQMLRTGQVSAERTQHALDVIARNTEAQTQIVEDLLDVSRIASGKVALEIESVDLPALVQGVLDGATLALGAKDLRLKRMLDTTATPVLGDAARLRQIVSNLVANAIKFTPKGGSITVVLHRAESDVELLVKDTGVGIAREFIGHIFEAFRQEDAGMNRRSQGLGLGLAIVRKLVELHGGTVTAESDGPGTGAVFRVRIPMAPLLRTQAPPPPEAATSLAQISERLLEGVRVLLVEDELDSRELLAMVLERCGAEVVEADRAEAAIALLDRGEQFHIMISDVGMPGMDGIELVGAIRARGDAMQRLPAVALTAYTRAVDRTRAIQAGFHAHVPKPVDANELLTVVASVTGRAR